MITLTAIFAVAVLVEASPEAATELNNQAVKLYMQARYSEAEQAYRKAMEAATKAGPAATRTRAIASSNLGTLLRVTGRYREAEKMLSNALNELQADRTTPAVNLGRTLEGLANVYQASGDLARAESMALRAQELYAGRSEIPARDRINLNLVLASVYVDQKRHGEAETLVRASLDATEGYQSAIAHNALSAIALARNDFAEAERAAQAALDKLRTSVPASHPALAMVLNNLAQACRFQAKYAAAEGHYRQALATWENAVGPSHADVAKGLMNLAAFYHERGREAGAEDLYIRAAAIFERTLGPTASHTLVARNELADVLRAERRYSEAERLGRSTIAAMEKVLAAGDPRLLRALGNRAKLFAETKRQNEAEALLARLRETTAAFK